MKRYSFLVVFLVFIFLYIVLNPGKGAVPVEKMDIPTGVAMDFIHEGIGEGYYSFPVILIVYTQDGEEVTHINFAEGKNIGETRADRQAVGNKKFLSGLEKVILIGEDMGREGIGNIIDVLKRNPNINDLGMVAVCKGRALDFLKLKIEGYPDSMEYIQGMIESNSSFNFMSNNYKLVDIYVRLQAEGRKAILPYLEIVEGMPIIHGLVIFDEDKLVYIIDNNEAKCLNIMKYDNVKGIIDLRKDEDSYIDLYGRTKRTVECIKVNDKYSFTINIKYTGEIVNNVLDDKLEEDIDVLKKVEEELSKKSEATCYAFIDKMQNEYKMDLIGLGKYAAAKYGRDTGTDWDEVVSNSTINVNVDVKIDKIGRGRY